ncbi:hypothetical protein KHC33_04255 [Methanospirillum sp. J.3.6.1-F.2.7.3]|uniref:Uncharacterized protein n=1 Tax=Methanospirillum purgamenti TaxID=2834276 RepID=A0A8E7B398_9EURY|nr:MULTISPECIES: hypothetical protein [Methanospirillum]MDX8551906.1 hypothetical protein [Methanospirillum hungatei]QVV89733.1 hypothetical protein KHC33_04255 [Methanospirillum sp. J.3.6.1-F.2.7.3]
MVIFNLITPILPFLGGAAGAIIAFILASNNFEKQEIKKNEITKREVKIKISRGLLEEIEYIETKLNCVSEAREKLKTRLINDSFPDNPEQEDLDKIIKYFIQITPHYSIEKFNVFKSINTDFGLFEPEPLKKIFLLFYDLDLLYVQFNNLIKYPQNHKFIPSLMRKIPTTNQLLIDHIADLRNTLNLIVNN